MSEIKNGMLGLYDTEHWKCDRMMTMGFKGLSFDAVHNASFCFCFQLLAAGAREELAESTLADTVAPISVRTSSP